MDATAFEISSRKLVDPVSLADINDFSLLETGRIDADDF